MDRVRRVLLTLGLLPVSTFVVFALLEAAPGGPARAYVHNPHLRANDIAQLNREFGAAQPFYLQYAHWLLHMLHGDFGWSRWQGETVSSVVVERLPSTVELVSFGFVVTIVIGAAIGYTMARARSGVVRNALVLPALVGRAVPVVFLGLSLQLLVGMTGWLPIAEISSRGDFSVGDRLAHLILPVLSMSVPLGAWTSIIFRDFFLHPESAARRSVLGAVQPIARTAALIGPPLLAAGFIVDLLYVWFGEGHFFYYSLIEFDLGLMAAVLLLYSAAVVLTMLCAELLTKTPAADSARTSGLPPLRAIRRRRLSTIGVIAAGVLAVAACGAAAANVIVPVGPYAIDTTHWMGYPLAPGVGGHIFGTDENGRDLLSRLLYALRTTLGIATLAALVAVALGAVVAMLVPRSIRRAALSVAGIRPFAALPLILATFTVLVARFHSAGVLTPPAIALVIGVMSAPAIIPAFRAPAPAIPAGFIDTLACALLLEVTLSIFGFAVQLPTPSLGNLLVNGQSNSTIAPWAVLIPAITVIVLLCALYALGDDLRRDA